MPVNVNAGTGNYDPYFRSGIVDWSSLIVVPSLAHGAAASQDWRGAISDAMAVFLVKQDVAGTQATLAQSCLEARVCK